MTQPSLLENTTIGLPHTRQDENRLAQDLANNLRHACESPGYLLRRRDLAGATIRYRLASWTLLFKYLCEKDVGAAGI